MHYRSLARRIDGVALALLTLRGAMVAAHFAVMLWLAGRLGLGGFGDVTHLWAQALVVSTIVSVGGPLVLLRAAPNEVLRWFLRVAVLAPAAIGCVLGMILLLITDGADLIAVLVLALAIGWVQNVASTLRVWGHVASSMLLRDGVPVLVLGAVAFWPVTAEALILRAAGVLLLIGLAALAYGIATARPNDREENGEARQGRLWLSSVLGMGQAQADLVVAGMFLAPEVFGLYALVRRVVNLVALPVSVAGWVSAGPISDAFGRNDRVGLDRAVTRASAIAWYPALALAAVGVALSASAALLEYRFAPAEAFALGAVLLVGALLQAFWAATYPLANLGPATGLAVAARALSLAIYSVAAFVAGAEMGAFGHALTFTVATSLGSWHLWLRLRRRFGVDASARSLWQRPEATWRTV